MVNEISTGVNPQTGLDNYIVPQDSAIYDLNFKQNDYANWIGFNWEIKVRAELLTLPFIQFQGNPTNWTEWKSKQGNNGIGYDGIVTLPNGEILTIEMKYRKEGGKVYHSWFMDDWEPRRADIYITNNIEAISYQDKRILDKNHSKLLSIEDAKVYISQLIHKILHCNQLVSWNSYTTDILSKISSRFTSFLNKMLVLKPKGRSRSDKCEANSAVKSGNPEPNSQAQEMGEDVFSFIVTEIPSNKISSLLEELEATNKLPIIKAYKLSKEEFQKAIDTYVTAIARRLGNTKSDVEQAIKLKGFSVQYPSEYWIFLMADTPEEENQVLMRELAKISWREWFQTAKDNWRKYVN